MSQDSQIIEITDNIELDQRGVCFDPDNISLYGTYTDELSAYRARKLWAETLEANFLLEESHDFTVTVSSSLQAGRFRVSCSFLTACARYAFWRLTNNQAPEAQYVIETAHIPICDSRHDEILRAPDLRSVHDEPLIFKGLDGRYRSAKKPRFSSWLRGIIKRLRA